MEVSLGNEKSFSKRTTPGYSKGNPMPNIFRSYEKILIRRNQDWFNEKRFLFPNELLPLDKYVLKSLCLYKS